MVEEQRVVFDGRQLILKGAGPPVGFDMPLRNEPCSCGSGVKFKSCCWPRTQRPSGHKGRLLVVGAGASVAECEASGRLPTNPLPVLKNFAAKLFQTSESLELLIAAYLDAHGIRS